MKIAEHSRICRGVFAESSVAEWNGREGIYPLQGSILHRVIDTPRGQI